MSIRSSSGVLGRKVKSILNQQVNGWNKRYGIISWVVDMYY